MIDFLSNAVLRSTGSIINASPRLRTSTRPSVLIPGKETDSFWLFLHTKKPGWFEIRLRIIRAFSLKHIFQGLCQMVLMTSKTSLQKWSGVFLFPSVSPMFFQIGTVTYQHRLRFRWRGFMYEFLPLIRKARTRCDLTGFHLAARSAQVLSLGRLACWRSSRPGARGLSARFNTLFLSRATRLCPVAVDITMFTRRKLRLEEVYSERSQKHFQRQLLVSWNYQDFWIQGNCVSDHFLL